MNKLNLLKIGLCFVLIFVTSLLFISSTYAPSYTLDDFYNFKENQITVYKPTSQLIDITDEFNITSKQNITVNVPQTINTLDKVCDGEKLPEIFYVGSEQNRRFCCVLYKELSTFKLFEKDITKKTQFNAKFDQPNNYKVLKAVNESYLESYTIFKQCTREVEGCVDEECLNTKLVNQTYDCNEIAYKTDYRVVWKDETNPLPILDLDYNKEMCIEKNNPMDTVDTKLIINYKGVDYESK